VSLLLRQIVVGVGGSSRGRGEEDEFVQLHLRVSLRQGTKDERQRQMRIRAKKVYENKG